jgi:hypothetical protein
VIGCASFAFAASAAASGNFTRSPSLSNSAL